MTPILNLSGATLSATDSEERIIGLMLDNRDRWLPAILALLPDPAAFTDPERQLIWRAVISLAAAGKRVTFDTLEAEVTRAQTHVYPQRLLILHGNNNHLILDQQDAVWHAQEIAIAHARRLHAEASEIAIAADLHPADLAAQLRTRLEAIERINLQAGTGLPHPRPLQSGLPPLPDPAWLPATLRPWIADIAERMQCPPDYPAVAALSALSSIAGRRFCIQPKVLDQSWFEFPTLWAMLIGRPSLMKSPAMQAAMRPLRALDRTAAETFDANERQRQGDQIRTRLQRTALEAKARVAAKTNAEFDYTVLIPDTDEPSPRRRLVVNDASLEALGEVLRDNPTGTLLYQDELAGLLAMLERDGNQALRAFLLQAWSGKEGFTFDRIGRGVRRVDHCSIALLGSIQPGVIAAQVRAANSHQAGADGFLQRFSLMVWPDLPAHWQHIDRPLDEQAEAAAHDVFHHFEHITPQDLLLHHATPGRDGVPTLRFTGEAQQTFDTWHHQLETRLRQGTLPHALESHLAKYRKLVPALALLIHVADNHPGPVSQQALENAIALAQHLEAHATRVYTSESVHHTELATTLLKKLQHPQCNLPTYFTVRQLCAKGWTGLVKSEAAELACEMLVDHHWLCATPVPTSDRGGRPTQIYHLNPLAQKATSPETRSALVMQGFAGTL
ncbi:MAG: hypothetical protein JWO08_1787 [Verrucomicrobiaceae bacterium]|nr:hypothetical protein [Verrucomicrobiaceae bacterium]